MAANKRPVMLVDDIVARSQKGLRCFDRPVRASLQRGRTANPVAMRRSPFHRPEGRIAHYQQLTLLPRDSVRLPEYERSQHRNVKKYHPTGNSHRSLLSLKLIDL
jgi:hypothetical protein